MSCARVEMDPRRHSLPLLRSAHLRMAENEAEIQMANGTAAGPSENNAGLTAETLRLFLRWATRSHPSDVELTADNLVEGVALVELLVSFSSKHFGELLDRLSNGEDVRAVRKFELVREHLLAFYEKKATCPFSTDAVASFLAPASEFVSGDEDSLMRLMIVVYGVAASTNHISTKEFNELLTASSPEVQQFTNEMVRGFASELSGNGRSESPQETPELRSKLKQAFFEIAQLKDEKSKLESDLARKELELTEYANLKLTSEEVDAKMEHIHNTQTRLRLTEDHCATLELRVGELSGREETLSKEVSKLRESLKSAEADLREVRDDKTHLEHRLSIATARSNEMEQKFARLQESSSQKPSERDHAALKDRYQKMLKRNSELEQQCQSLESYKMLLDSHKAHLEQVKAEKEGVLNELYTEQERSRELKGRLKEVESTRLSVQAETSEPITPTSLHDELSKAISFDYENLHQQLDAKNAEVANLRSAKKAVEDELSSVRSQLAEEKERHDRLVFDLRAERDRLKVEALEKFAEKPVEKPTVPQAPQIEAEKKQEAPKKRSNFCFHFVFLLLLPLLLVFIRFVLCVYVYDVPFTLFGTYSRHLR